MDGEEEFERPPHQQQTRNHSTQGCRCAFVGLYDAIVHTYPDWWPKQLGLLISRLSLLFALTVCAAVCGRPFPLSVLFFVFPPFLSKQNHVFIECRNDDYVQLLRIGG
jgi:hypothetical protein